jgi:hypothetical protein
VFPRASWTMLAVLTLVSRFSPSAGVVVLPLA